MTQETVDNIMQRLKDYDVEDVIDFLDISVEELVDRFEDKIQVDELWWVSETPQSMSEVDA